MSFSRREFLAGAAAVGLLGPAAAAAQPGAQGRFASRHPGGTCFPPRQDPDPTLRFDPWIEVDPTALAFNVDVVSRLVGGRPILAVIKNNGYGLGLTLAGKILEAHTQVRGLAVVKTEEALALKAAGVAKPVLLMALFADADGPELVARGVDLCLFTDDAAQRLARAVQGAGRPARVHAYLDTGMSRMGMPYHRAAPWLEALFQGGLRPLSTFTELAEDREFDREQVRRLLDVASTLRTRGVDPGALHASSSEAVFNLPEGYLDMVRPGIALFGAYPSNEGVEREIAELRPAFRLRARVVRVERLRAGDSVSYGRTYTAERPTWVATLPVGHSDGYPREAVKGAKVLLNGRVYPAVGAVSASHTIVELGEGDPQVRIGDVATLVGPDHPDIHPNAVATRTGRSVYDVLMHLHAGLPRVVV